MTKKIYDECGNRWFLIIRPNDRLPYSPLKDARLNRVKAHLCGGSFSTSTLLILKVILEKLRLSRAVIYKP